MAARREADRGDEGDPEVDPEILLVIQALARANARRDYAAAEQNAQERPR